MAKLTQDEIARLYGRYGLSVFPPVGGLEMLGGAMGAPGSGPGGAPGGETGGEPGVAPGGAPEALPGAAAGLPPAEALLDRWQMSRGFLLQFIREEMGDDAGLVDLAERVLADAKDGLEVMSGQRDSSEATIDRIEAGLEVIVQTDGSRPAYVIRDDDIVQGSSPPGVWTDLLGDVTRLDDIRAALCAVGRIDILHPGTPFAGTGWLIAGDVMVTNRHVAQLFVNFETGGASVIMPGRAAHVDFGHELNGTQSRNRRRITELLFCGAVPIPAYGIDHGLLDVAVFRLAAPEIAGPAQTPLPIGIGDHLAAPPTQIMVIGYPGEPLETSLGTVSETDKVLKLLFGKLWGYKRLAPGKIVASALTARTFAHDATTLGGNSGSLVMGLDTVPLVTGLHYGGQWGADRVNWGHVAHSVLDEPGLIGPRYATLRELCVAEGVGLVSPL